MSESDASLKTPSEILADKILEVLAEKKLVLTGDVQKISSKLSVGKLKAEDWRMVIEKAIDKEAANE